MQPDVLIIGAGAAGLAAARVLSDAGKSAIILEARNRIGGRILTHHPRGSTVPIELGAEFVHGRPDATWDLIRESGLIAVDLPPDHHRHQGGRLVRMADMDAQMNKVMSGLRRLGRKDMSFAQYLATRRKHPSLAQAQQFALHFVEGFDAAEPQRISAKSLAEEQEGIGNVEDETQFRLIDGYGSLIQYLRSTLDPARIKIRLHTTVSEIHWTKSGVECRLMGTKRAATFRARRAIITLPLGVLQLPPEKRGAVRFVPDIPARREAAMQLAPGQVVKAVLRFRTPFWEDPASAGLQGIDRTWRDAAFIHAPGAPFPTWWTMRPLHAPLLTAWAGGRRAVALAGLTRQELQNAAIATLAGLMKVQRSRLTAMLASFHTHDWASDPFSRGAYSYVAVDGMSAHARLAAPINDTLFFAGEATDTTGQASTVAGALASGQRAAREVLGES